MRARPFPGIRGMTLLPGALLLSVGFSCTDPAPTREFMTVSDSAGIEVIVFDLDQLPELGTVSPAPSWIFGDPVKSNADVPLNLVKVARILRSGRVIIANTQPPELLVLDPETGDIKDEMSRINHMFVGNFSIEEQILVAKDHMCECGYLPCA